MPFSLAFCTFFILIRQVLFYYDVLLVKIRILSQIQIRSGVKRSGSDAVS